MRQHTDDMKTGQWECRLADQWVRGPYDYTTMEATRIGGGLWLATLGDKLGVKLVPTWRGGEKAAAAVKHEA